MKRRSWVLIVVSSVAAAQERPIGQGVNLYSLEKEAALGAVLAKDVRRQTTPLESLTLSEYVERIGGRLAAEIPLEGWRFTFALITTAANNSTREPLSLPGGYIFVPAGLFLAAQEEAEFAGMLAHSMAHIAARHGTRMATRGTIANMDSVPLIFMGGWTGYGGEEQLTIPIGFLSFARANELEADRIAARAIYEAGYDPGALARYIGRTQKVLTDQQRIRSALPSRDERVSRLEEILRALPERTYTPTPGEEFLRIQEEARNLTPTPVRRAPSLR